jgi:hypothetical protein
MNMEERRELTRLAREELAIAMDMLMTTSHALQNATRHGTKTEMLDAMSLWDKALADSQTARTTCMGFLGEEVEQWIGES